MASSYPSTFFDQRSVWQPDSDSTSFTIVNQKQRCIKLRVLKIHFRYVNQIKECRKEFRERNFSGRKNVFGDAVELRVTRRAAVNLALKYICDSSIEKKERQSRHGKERWKNIVTACYVACLAAISGVENPFFSTGELIYIVANNNNQETVKKKKPIEFINQRCKEIRKELITVFEFCGYCPCPTNIYLTEEFSNIDSPPTSPTILESLSSSPIMLESLSSSSKSISIDSSLHPKSTLRNRANSFTSFTSKNFL